MEKRGDINSAYTPAEDDKEKKASESSIEELEDGPQKRLAETVKDSVHANRIP